MRFVRFLQKQSAGFYFIVLAIAVTAVAMGMFFTVDPSFESFLRGVYVAPYVACTVIAMVIEVAAIVLEQIFEAREDRGMLRNFLMLLLHIAAVALFCEALIQMIWSGVYEAAMALTSQLGDHETAYYYLAVVIVDVVGVAAAMVSAFLPTVKGEKRAE